MNRDILILDGQAVQTLIVAESLYKKGYIIHLFCDSTLSYGYHTRYAKFRCIAPNPKTEEIMYISFLEKYLIDKQIDAIIPMTDESAFFISKYKKRLQEIVHYVIPDIDIFNRAYDKNELMHLCAQKNYPHPLTIDLSRQEISAIREFDMKFPAIIKPNITTGGRGMAIVHSIDELALVYPRIYKQYGSCHLQQYIKKGGKQIKVQLFVDRTHNQYYSSVIDKQRYYPENGGSSCCNITIEENELVLICRNILDDLTWEGFADFDLIQDPDDGIYKIMEINPRLPACIKSAVLSGLDYPEIIIDASLGNRPKKYNYRSGKKLRHLGLEILWFLHSKERFKTKPSWFCFRGKDLSFQDFSWSDPMPFIFGTYGNIYKQLNPDFRKSRSGLR